MNGQTMVGVVLLALGLLGMAVPFFTTRQTTEVARLGDLKLQTTESKSYAIPPLVSVSGVVLGIALIGAGMYRRR